MFDQGVHLRKFGSYNANGIVNEWLDEKNIFDSREFENRDNRLDV